MPVLFLMIFVQGCSGGGTTGHEGLDTRTPLLPVPDGGVGIETDPPSTVDASGVPIDVAESGSGAVQPDAADVSAPMDVADTSSDISAVDTFRVRDGAVVRDGLIIDPSDAPGDTNGDGFIDVGPPTVCGDKKVEGKEQCDDGNTLNGDGCSALCTDQKTCDECMALNCPDVYPDVWPLCESVKGNAMKGEAAGRPRKDLCQETYTCLLRSQCVNWGNRDINPCYCGTIDSAACLAGQTPNGSCRTEIENGMETTDVSVLLPNMGNPMFAAGAAVRARICGQHLCNQECGPQFGDAGAITDSGAADTLSQ
jgi:cysteine-rich repeat protein